VTAVLLALLTAVVWGLANYLGPLLSRAHPMGAVLVYGQVVGVVGGALLYAYDGTGPPDVRNAAFGIAAGIANGLALLTFYRAAAIGPISVVAPIGATGGVVPVITAIAVGERPLLSAGPAAVRRHRGVRRRGRQRPRQRRQRARHPQPGGHRGLGRGVARRAPGTPAAGGRRRRAGRVVLLAAG